MADLQPTPDPTPPKVGATFGRYAIEAELGHGGQGSVYLARDARLGRAVALKVLHPRGPLTERAASRLEREGLLAARIDHPSACEVYDCGIHEGQPFLAMRYVDGEPLAELIRRSPPGDLDHAEVERRLLWIEQVADALHSAHQLGILHRDVKPGNVMVARDGRAVLLDFGLAKETSSEALSLTAEGMLCGTPDYMSPEQLTIDAPPLDGRTDVYSLGATLYELIAGARPFGNSTELFPTLASRQRLPQMRAVGRVWNRDLSAVLERALAVDRTQRYDSARAFADDLRRCRLRLPVAARPASTALRLKRWASRNRALATALAATAVSLLLGAVFSLRFAIDASAARDQSEWRRYAGSLTLAARALGDGDRPAALLALDDCDPAQRGHEWHLLCTQTDVALRRLSLGERAVHQLHLAAHGTLTIAMADGELLSCPADGEPQQFAPPWPTAKVLACAAAGGLRVLAVESGGRTQLHFARGEVTFELPSPVRKPRLTVAPDGSGVCVCGFETTHCISFAERRALGPALTRGTVNHPLFAARADGLHLVLPFDINIEQRCAVEVRRWPDLTLRTEFGISDGYCDSATVSRDGHRLFVANSDRRQEHRSGAVQAWHLADGTRLARYTGRLGRALALEVSPDDEWIAIGEASGAVRVLDGALSTELRTLLGHSGAVTALRALDGRRLAAGTERGELRIFAPRQSALVAVNVWPVRGLMDLRFAEPAQRLWLASEFGVRGYDLRGERPTVDHPCRGRVLGTSAADDRVWFTSLVGGSPIDELDGPTRTARRVVADQPEWIRAAVLDPDARTAFAVRHAARLQLWRIRATAGELEEQLIDTLAPAAGEPVLARSTDGRWLAGASGTEVSTWLTATGERIARREAASRISHLSFGAEGTLAVGCAGGQLWVTDTTLTPDATQQMASEIRALAMHPSAPRLAVACSGGTVTICSTAPLQPIVTLPRCAAEIARLIFDRVGERLALGFADGRAEVFATHPDAAPKPPPDPAPPQAAGAPIATRAARRVVSRQRRYGYEADSSYESLAERPNAPNFLHQLASELEFAPNQPGPSADWTALRCLALMRSGRDADALRLAHTLDGELSPDEPNRLAVRQRLAVVRAVCGDAADARELAAEFAAMSDTDRASVQRIVPEARLVLGTPHGIAAVRWIRDHSNAAEPARATALAQVEDTALRAAITELLALYPPSAAPLRDAAWLIVSTPGLEPADYERAAQWAAQADALEPREARPELLASALVRLGRAGEALAILDRLGELDVQRDPIRRWCAALAHAQLGQWPAAELAAAQCVIALGDARLSNHELRSELRAEVQRALAR